MKTYYFAYGSNLTYIQMIRRCPSAEPLCSFNLPNYKLVYRGCEDNYAYLTIEPCEDSIVPVELYQISSKDIASLDYYEGFPSLYHKEYIDIKVKNKNKKALIYVMNDGYGYHKPSDEYRKTCEIGYSMFNFDMNILNKAYDDTIEEMSIQKK